MILFLICFIFTACDLDLYYVQMPKDAETEILPSFEKYVSNFLLEQESERDFSSKTVIAKIFVPELPDATWFTAETPSFGSSYAKTGGEVFYRIAEFPATFRYCGPNSDENSKKLFWTQMPLLAVSDFDKAFMPCAAEAWSFAEDGKTVYYKLNEKAKWSDGTSCTAEDFVFALEFFTSLKILDPVINANFYGLTIKKISDYCIGVTCQDAVNFSQAELLHATNIKPVCKNFYKGHIPENWVYDYNDKVEPTTGPYVLTEYNENKGLTFTKIKNWWGFQYKHYQGVANFDKVNFYLVLGSTTAALNSFKMGKFDLLELDNTSSYFNYLTKSFITDGYITPWQTSFEPLIGMCGFFFNTKNKILKDKNIREAVFYALDIESIGKQNYYNNLKRLKTLGKGEVFAGINFNNENLPQINFDAEKANELLNKSEFNRFNSKGIRVNQRNKKLKLEILYSIPISREILGLLNQQAKKAGIELNFKFMDSGHIKKAAKGNFQIYFTKFDGFAIPNHYTDFHSKFAKTEGLNNICGLEDATLDAMLEKYNKFELSLEEQAKLNKQIEKKVLENFVFFPFYYSNSKTFLTWKWICFPGWINQKYDEHFTNAFLSYAWFDKNIYDEVINARKNGNIVPVHIFTNEE